MCQFTQVRAHQLNLQRCTFRFPSQFTDCAFHHLTYDAHLGERITFNHCRTIPHRGKTPQGFRFTHQDLQRIAFLNMNLSHTHLMGADLQKTRFISCEWDTQGGYRVVPEHAEIVDTPSVESLASLERLYAQLKCNLEDDKAYDKAGDFHYREMEIRLKRLRLEKHQWWDRKWLTIYKALADFGESYNKLLCTMLGSLTLTGVILSFSKNGLPPLFTTAWWNDGFTGIFNSMYHALMAIAPFAVGRTVTATIANTYNGYAKLLMIGEGLLLLTLTTLFVMAVRRRFRR